MLNVNVYYPTPVILGPIALINPQHKKVVGTQGFNQSIAN